MTAAERRALVDRALAEEQRRTISRWNAYLGSSAGVGGDRGGSERYKFAHTQR